MFAEENDELWSSLDQYSKIRVPKQLKHHERDKSDDDKWSSKRQKKKSKGKKPIRRTSDELEDNELAMSSNLDDSEPELVERNKKDARVCLILNNLDLFQIRESNC